MFVGVRQCLWMSDDLCGCLAMDCGCQVHLKMSDDDCGCQAMLGDVCRSVWVAGIACGILGTLEDV